MLIMWEYHFFLKENHRKINCEIITVENAGPNVQSKPIFKTNPIKSRL